MALVTPGTIARIPAARNASAPIANSDLDGAKTPIRVGPPTKLSIRNPEADARNAGADLNSASSDFKALGAFFCNFATLSFLRLVSRSRARSAARPRTTSCGFEAAEAIPFPGADSIFSSRCGAISRRLLSAVSPLAPRSRRPKRLGSKIDRLGDLRRDGTTRTNIEHLRHSGKTFVERLGSYGTLPKSFPRVIEGIFPSRYSLIFTQLFQYITSIFKTGTFILRSCPQTGLEPASPGSEEASRAQNTHELCSSERKC